MTDNRTVVILSTKKDVVYTLVKSTEEEVNEIKHMLDNDIQSEKYPFLNYVILGGNIKSLTDFDTSDIMVPDFIKKVKTKIVTHNGYKIDEVKHFKCFARNTPVYAFNNINLHEDSLSSFKCACQTKNITHFFVLKERKGDTIPPNIPKDGE